VEKERSIMKPYQNTSGTSVVKSYAAQPDGIIIVFTNGEAYTYTHASAGSGHIETMKKLARKGQGLGEYIENVVKHGYARQLK
jgi:hypothetical protein